MCRHGEIDASPEPAQPAISGLGLTAHPRRRLGGGRRKAPTLHWRHVSPDLSQVGRARRRLCARARSAPAVACGLRSGRRLRPSRRRRDLREQAVRREFAGGCPGRARSGLSARRGLSAAGLQLRRPSRIRRSHHCDRRPRPCADFRPFCRGGTAPAWRWPALCACSAAGPRLTLSPLS
jgi:hypothetical protein